MTDKEEHEQEKQVLNLSAAQWDTSPYTVALSIKEFLKTHINQGSNIDSGNGPVWPFGAPAPIDGHAEADLWATIGGKEFYITVRKSNNQLIKEGVTPEQLGLPPEESST